MHSSCFLGSLLRHWGKGGGEKISKRKNGKDRLVVGEVLLLPG